MSAMTREKTLVMLEALDRVPQDDHSAMSVTISAAQVMALLTISDSLDGIANAIEEASQRMISVEVHET
jgi:hypothetical protein